MLTREEMLARGKAARKSEEVGAPELGEGTTLIVREMTSIEREQYMDGIFFEDSNDPDEQGYPKRKQKPGVLARLVAFSVVDGKGNLVFSEKDIPEIGEWSSDLVDRIAAVAGRLSKLGIRAQETERKN